MFTISEIELQELKKKVDVLLIYSDRRNKNIFTISGIELQELKKQSLCIINI